MAKPPGKKILIVDDEPGVRELLSDFLKLRGYETLAVENGVEALEKAPQFLPNLIFLDIMMPKMDGWQTLAQLRLREETKNIPVVMLTARRDTATLLKSEQERALDYFIKPIDLEELATFIKRYIDLNG